MDEGRSAMIAPVSELNDPLLHDFLCYAPHVFREREPDNGLCLRQGSFKFVVVTSGAGNSVVHRFRARFSVFHECGKLGRA